MSFHHLQHFSSQQWKLQETVLKQRLLEREQTNKHKYSYLYRPETSLSIISAYLTCAEKQYHLLIHADIKQVIIIYVPNYLLLAAGRNSRYGALGISNIAQDDQVQMLQFTKLPDLSLLCCNVHNLYINASRIFVQSTHGEIYGAGCNTYHELAVSTLSNIRKFERIDTCLHDGIDHDIKMVSRGCDNFYHSFFIGQHDEIFVCGCNYRGQFGDGTKSEASFKSMPMQIDNTFITQNGDSVKDIQCGCRHSVVLSTNGNLFCFGSNQYGQVGEKQEVEHVLSPKHVQHEHTIQSIKIGRFRTFFVDVRQRLYGFGWNDRGQLGVHHEDEAAVLSESVWGCQPIPYFEEIKIHKIECGSGHTLCVDEQGKCYVFGWSKYGQCGDAKSLSDNAKLSVFQPFRLQLGDEFSDKVVDVAGGFAHSAILNEENKLFTFGHNQYQQCSATNKSSKIYKPYYVSKPGEMRIHETDYIERVLAMPDSTIVVINRNGALR